MSDSVLSTPISEFYLSKRAKSALRALHVNTLGDLAGLTKQDLVRRRNVGATTITELKALLARFELSLKEVERPAPIPEDVLESLVQRTERKYPGLIARLGKESDPVIGKAFGLTHQRIQQIRLKLGIPKWQ